MASEALDTSLRFLEHLRDGKLGNAALASRPSTGIFTVTSGMFFRQIAVR